MRTNIPEVSALSTNVNSMFKELYSVAGTTPRTLCTIGDSRIAMGYVQAPLANYFVDNGFLQWALGFAGVDVKILNSAATSGYNLDQMIASFSTGVLPYNPTDVLIMGFTNELMLYTPSTSALLQVAYDTISAKLKVLYDLCLNAGYFMHIVSETANDTLSADRRKLINPLNEFTREYCRQNPAFAYYSDAYSVTVDPASATGGMLSSITYDGLHVNNLGAFKIGQVVAASFLTRFPLIQLPKGQYESKNVNNQSKNILKNPMLQGTTGVIDVGTSGTLPTDWQAYSHAADSSVMSIVAADTVGNAINMAYNVAAARTFVLISGDVYSINSPQKNLYAVCRIKCTAAGQLLGCQFTFNSNASASSIWGNPSAAARVPLPAGWTITIKTPVCVSNNTISVLKLKLNMMFAAADSTTVLKVEGFALYQDV